MTYSGRSWSADAFHDANCGLLLARVLLPAGEWEVERPEWTGVEVTGNPCYSDRYLAEHPFMAWSPEESTL